MDRRISLSTPLTAGVASAIALIATGADVLEPQSGRLEVSPLSDGEWTITLTPRGRASEIPRFAGELSLANAKLSLIGDYRVDTSSSDEDAVAAHLVACEALQDYLDGVARRIDAAVKRRPAPMSTGTGDYAEDFRRRHGVSV